MVKKTHNLRWTREKINNFWDALSSNTDVSEYYFGENCGPYFVRAIKKDLVGKSLLDIGFGNGAILKLLVQRKFLVYGIESSIENINKALENFKSIGIEPDLRKFKIPLPFESNFFDNILLTEVIEHLIEGEINTILNESYRILNDNGVIVITVPYKENLRKSFVVCPDCGAIFHNIQHITSWDENSIKETLERIGFKIKKIKITDFEPRLIIWGKKLLSILYNKKYLQRILVIARK